VLADAAHSTREFDVSKYLMRSNRTVTLENDGASDSTAQMSSDSCAASNTANVKCGGYPREGMLGVFSKLLQSAHKLRTLLADS
jgi:hypothetical protein